MACGYRATDIPSFNKLHPDLPGRVAFHHLPGQQVLSVCKSEQKLSLVVALQESADDIIAKKCEGLSLDFKVVNWSGDEIPATEQEGEEKKPTEKREPAVVKAEGMAMIETVLSALKDGKNVLVYCYCGSHRSGTFAFLLARSVGLSAMDSYRYLNFARPLSQRVAVPMLKTAESEYGKDVESSGKALLGLSGFDLSTLTGQKTGAEHDLFDENAAPCTGAKYRKPDLLSQAKNWAESGKAAMGNVECEGDVVLRRIA